MTAAASTAMAPVHDGPLLAALGGHSNLMETHATSSRLRVRVRNMGSVNEPALKSAGVRMIARPAPDVIHLILAPGAAEPLAGGL